MVEGDTIYVTLINPEDDVHSFVVTDLAIPMPPQKSVAAMYPVQSHPPTCGDSSSCSRARVRNESRAGTTRAHGVMPESERTGGLRELAVLLLKLGITGLQTVSHIN